MRRRNAPDELTRVLLRLIADPQRSWPFALALLLVLAFLWWVQHTPQPPAPEPDLPPPPVAEAGQPGDYLFCFWNVENLFDDRDDRRRSADEPYDNWFARDAAARTLKLQHLSDALVKLNGGRGPDILACVELESVRAAELLRDALNQRLPDPALSYRYVLMKEVDAGRHIAPAIITRLPVRESETRLVGSRLRILEGHVTVNGFDLTVVASHWTSHINDDQGAEGRREKYGSTIYELYRDRSARDPATDFLVCGDFNDPPDAPSVRDGLRATGDRGELLRGGPQPLLLDLMAGKDPGRFGTHYHNRLLIYDQFAVSRGLLDEQGWSCDPDSVVTVNTLVRPGDRRRAPWRFGNERDSTFERGYSDHFPVTVRLRVQGR